MMFYFSFFTFSISCDRSYYLSVRTYWPQYNFHIVKCMLLLDRFRPARLACRAHDAALIDRMKVIFSMDFQQHYIQMYNLGNVIIPLRSILKCKFWHKNFWLLYIIYTDMLEYITFSIHIYFPRIALHDSLFKSNTTGPLQIVFRVC